ncbi:MAG: TlpA family protein disulfide reductase [Acidobacteriota bacterium]
MLYLLLLAAGVAFFARMRTFSAPAQLNLQATEFQRLDGSALPAQALEGKAVVLNFWAPWCPPCRVEMPWLDDLQKTEPGVVVLGVEDDPDEYAHAMDFARRKAITYPLVRFAPDLDRKLGGIHTLPTTLFISRSGRVVHAVRGAIPEVVMRRFARDAEKAP